MPEKIDDVLDLIIRHESGELSDAETLKLFGHLIRTGQAWTLQGHYGRTATMLIEVGALNEDGTPGPAAYFTEED